MVVGNAASGQDISIELVDVAKEIHLSAKSLDISEGLSRIISKHHNLHLHLQVLPLYHLPWAMPPSKFSPLQMLRIAD